MELTQEHELHKRRAGRNYGVLAVLLALVALVFGLTLAKIGREGPDQMQGFDHTYRIELDPGAIDPDAAPAAAAGTQEAGQ